MSEELISKKELLELTNISYGQLYRWKRKDLIPEDWFIRKSTFTGQETFFPKEKILDRIDKIQKFKENLSLDELANMFSPSVKELNLTKEEIVKRGIASQKTVSFYLHNRRSQNAQHSSDQILTIYMLESLLQSGEINLEEANMVLQVLEDYFEKTKQNFGELYILRKLGVTSCFLVTSNTEIYFEKGTKVVARLPLAMYIEELQTKLI